MKTLKSVNSQIAIQGKKLLGLILISGVFGVSLFGCAQQAPTPEASKPSPTTTAKSSATTTAKPSATTTAKSSATTTAKPSPTNTVKSVPATTTPKPSPKPSATTPASQANQSPQNPLPQPNAKGDYSRTYHKLWQIADSSGKGVSCRMSKATIEQIQTPGNSVVLDIGSWPVIGNFKNGQSFEINLGPAGFGILSDTKKEPWIFVEKSLVQGAPAKCFVRANSSFVKPIQPK